MSVKPCGVPYPSSLGKLRAVAVGPAKHGTFWKLRSKPVPEDSLDTTRTLIMTVIRIPASSSRGPCTELSLPNAALPSPDVYVC